MFYLKLALNNIKNAKEAFGPFILASLVLYLLNGSTLLVLFSPIVKTMRQGTITLALATIVLSFFSVIVAIYSFNVLLKQRSREFGLYNMLGMNKRQIGLVASLELVAILLIVLGLGSLLSSGFAHVFYLIFIHLVRGNHLDFSLSSLGFLANSMIFSGIFALLMLIGWSRVRSSSPLVLFQTAESGEREPKGNAFLALLSLLALGGGYTLSLTSHQAEGLLLLGRFFIAVILVIIGTYLFYMSFIAWFLKHRRANKTYFYQPEHFITTSQMIFRMKQHATGLANITMLAIMSFVTIATTVALHTGMISNLDRLYIDDTNTQIRFVAEEEGQGRADFQKYVLDKLPEHKPYINYQVTMFPVQLGQGRQFVATADARSNGDGLGLSYLYVVSLEDFRKFGNEVADLAPGQAYFYQPNGANQLDSFEFLGYHLTIKDNLKTARYSDLLNTVSSVLLVVENAQVRDALYQAHTSLKNPPMPFDSRYQVFMTLTEEELQDLKTSNADLLSPDGELIATVLTRKDFHEVAIGFTGGFLFVGFLLGIAFLLGAALIIYYKQYSEGHEDKRSYRILQEVGMSRQDVKGTINSQVLTVFFMPLVIAVLHFLLALTMLKQMLALFAVHSSVLIYTVSGLVILGVIVFYFAIYKLTSRTYYRMIER
ncbi:ABC transporter permease [Streptococcus sp. E24BD]|uniref:ABC transporter permease n=1 Tax=Streptococcus sp. E24BD TaxID=3278715 RepID=UPI00359D6EA1